MAHEAEIPLTLDDFTEIGKKVPVLCDLKAQGSITCLISSGWAAPPTA